MTQHDWKAQEIEFTYRVMDRVLAEIQKLQDEDPDTRDALGKLQARLQASGGLADPSGDPRMKLS